MGLVRSALCQMVEQIQAVHDCHELPGNGIRNWHLCGILVSTPTPCLSTPGMPNGHPPIPQNTSLQPSLCPPHSHSQIRWMSLASANSSLSGAHSGVGRPEHVWLPALGVAQVVYCILMTILGWQKRLVPPQGAVRIVLLISSMHNQLQNVIFLVINLWCACPSCVWLYLECNVILLWQTATATPIPTPFLPMWNPT